MKLLNKSEDLLSLMREVKGEGGLLITNFFLDPEKLAYWVVKRKVFFHYSKNGILIFRKNSSFYHLYYYTTSLEKLQFLLINNLPKEQLVIDLIGKEQNLIKYLHLFKSLGFLLHRQLDRYIRINKENRFDYEASSKEVTIAVRSDSDNIAELFIRNFDKFSEQVPEIDEVEKLIEDQKILVVRDKQVIKGFLVRTFNGQTTILNNFLVAKPYRGERIGSKLLKHYIFESQSIKRMILWVISDNTLAIGAYVKYGYTKEGLIDYVLVNN